MSSLGEPIEGLANTPARPQLATDVLQSQIDLRQGVPSPDLRLTLHPRRLSPERHEARIDYEPPRHSAIVNPRCEQNYGQWARKPRPRLALGPASIRGGSAYDPHDTPSTLAWEERDELGRSSPNTRCAAATSARLFPESCPQRADTRSAALGSRQFLPAVRFE